MNWILSAIISAITFALGDAVVVKEGMENGSSLPLFLSYTILMGIFGIVYIIFNPEYKYAIYIYKWHSIVAITFLYMIAYYSHFIALIGASNPGYANALVMFHVVILSLISYYFLNKPLNNYTLFGILLMFIGAYFIIMYN